jgi:hypothetical protein
MLIAIVSLVCIVRERPDSHRLQGECSTGKTPGPELFLQNQIICLALVARCTSSEGHAKTCPNVCLTAERDLRCRSLFARPRLRSFVMAKAVGVIEGVFFV